MSQPNQTDPFAGGDKRPSVSFKDKPIGTSYSMVVDDVPNLIQARDYDTEQPAFWPDGQPKMTVVTNVVLNGEEMSLWAPKPSSMFSAIQAAQKVADAQLSKGGTLTVTFTGEKPNENAKKNAQKLYSAVYVAPSAFASDDPWNPGTAAPAAAAAAPAPAAPAVDENVAKAKQLIALGIDDATIATSTGLGADIVAAIRNAA